MASIFDWSATPNSNTSVNGDSLAEGMSPGLINNDVRDVMALIRQTFDASLQNFFNASAQLPIANGGTGAATAVAALAALGGLASTYRGINPVTKTGNWTFADSEAGRGMLYLPSPLSATATGTINPEGTTAITYGSVYPIANYATVALTISAGAGVTLKVNGGSAVASATIAANGSGSLVKWGADNWILTGAGIS